MIIDPTGVLWAIIYSREFFKNRKYRIFQGFYSFFAFRSFFLMKIVKMTFSLLDQPVGVIEFFGGLARFFYKVNLSFVCLLVCLGRIPR